MTNMYGVTIDDVLHTYPTAREAEIAYGVADKAYRYDGVALLPRRWVALGEPEWRTNAEQPGWRVVSYFVGTPCYEKIADGVCFHSDCGGN